MTEKEYVSPIMAAIAAIPRKVHEFDISGFFHTNGTPIPRIGIRVPTKAEQDSAIDQAHADIAANVKAESARTDEDIIRDRKTVHIIQKACIDPRPNPDPADPKNASKCFYYPAFDDPKWISKHLTTDQIGVLLNLVNGVRAAESSEPTTLDEATIASFHAAAVGPSSSSIVGEFLASCDREFLIHLYIAEALRLEVARAENDELKARLAALEKPDGTEVHGGHLASTEADASG